MRAMRRARSRGRAWCRRLLVKSRSRSRSRTRRRGALRRARCKRRTSPCSERCGEREHASCAEGSGRLAPPHETECTHHPPATRSMTFRRTTEPPSRYGASPPHPSAGARVDVERTRARDLETGCRRFAQARVAESALALGAVQAGGAVRLERDAGWRGRAGVTEGVLVEAAV